MRNIIDAIKTIIEEPNRALNTRSASHNRANSAGDALEDYIKDAFAGAFGLSPDDRRTKLSEEFSYLGNSSNPPDAMIKQGPAIEIKKIENHTADLALNSSYPKDKLYSDSSMISRACKECETWQIKDMIYAVGEVGEDDQKLHTLIFVYGVDYCADREVYEKIKKTIKNGVESIEGVDFTETKELGKIKKVDPLGITDLRVRGMWHIENPFVLFSDFYKIPANTQFSLIAIINNDYFNALPNKDTISNMQQNVENLDIKDIRIQDPNNPAVLKPAKIITFYESN